SAYQQKLLTEPLNTSWAGPGEGRTFLTVLERRPVLRRREAASRARHDAEPRRGATGRSLAQAKPLILHMGHGKTTRCGDRDWLERGRGRRHSKTSALRAIGHCVLSDLGPRAAPEHRAAASLFAQRQSLRPTARTHAGRHRLGVVVWQGTFEKWNHTWLRWCD